MNSITDSILYHGGTPYRKVGEEHAQPVDFKARWRSVYTRASRAREASSVFCGDPFNGDDEAPAKRSLRQQASTSPAPALCQCGRPSPRFAPERSRDSG